MKKLTILLGLILAAGLVTADQDTSGKSKTIARSESKVTAEVISVDQSSKTITVRASDGTTATSPAESLTLPVQGRGVASLKGLTAGQAVTLTCRVAAPAPMASDLAPGKAATSHREWSLNDCSAVTAISKSRTAVRNTSTSSVSPSGDAAAMGTASASASVDSSAMAVVVAADEGALTLTVKDTGVAAAATDSRTLSVDAKAATSLRNLQSGEQVRITCRESGAGASPSASANLSECASITSIIKVAALDHSSSFDSSSAFDSVYTSGLSSTATSSSADLSASASTSATTSEKLRASAAANPPDSAVASSASMTRSSTTSAKINAVVVAVDTTANTVTVSAPGTATAGTMDTKTETHDNLTLPVEGKAATSLKELKSGERVMLTCREGAAAPAGSSSSKGADASMDTRTTGGKDNAVAAGDTGWSMAKAGKCAAVTDISKARATTSSSPDAKH
jgi:hypothetical protein